MKVYYVAMTCSDGYFNLLGPYFDSTTANKHVMRTRAYLVQELPLHWGREIGVRCSDMKFADAQPGYLNDVLGLSKFPTIPAPRGENDVATRLRA